MWIICPGAHGGTCRHAAYAELPNLTAEASKTAPPMPTANTGCDDARVLLALLQYFRGNLENWDLALIYDLAESDGLLHLDNVASKLHGTRPDMIEQMARDAIASIAALWHGEVDLLGSSSAVLSPGTRAAPASPGPRLILTYSAPEGAAGMHGWAPHVIGASWHAANQPEEYLGVFFAGSATSKQAGKRCWASMYARTEDATR